MKLPEPVAWMLNGCAAFEVRREPYHVGPEWDALFTEAQLREALAHQEAAMQQALDHLINLQPKLANGLLNDRQLQFIDPYVDEAIKALQDALKELTAKREKKKMK